MKKWFVIPDADGAAFRAVYDANVTGETLGSLYPNAAGTHCFFGSDRITEIELAVVLALAPTAVAHDSWPPPGGWENPPMA